MIMIKVDYYYSDLAKQNSKWKENKRFNKKTTLLLTIEIHFED